MRPIVSITGPTAVGKSAVQGKSPRNQTEHCPLPAGHEPRDLIGKVLEVRVETARTCYLSGQSVGEPR